MTSNYPVVDNGLDGVFQFLYQSVALQDVDDSNVEQKSFTLTIASRNSTRSIKTQEATPEINSSVVAVMFPIEVATIRAIKCQ